MEQLHEPLPELLIGKCRSNIVVELIQMAIGSRQEILRCPGVKGLLLYTQASAADLAFPDQTEPAMHYSLKALVVQFPFDIFHICRHMRGQLNNISLLYGSACTKITLFMPAFLCVTHFMRSPFSLYFVPFHTV